MKKEYKKPEFEVIKLRTINLLQSSVQTLRMSKTGDTYDEYDGEFN